MDQRPTDQFVKVQALNIRYWQQGNHDACILLVHGIGACVEYWYKNIDVFADSYRVIAVDLPGFGKSDKPNVEYTLDFYAHFLKDFLDAVGVKKVFLFGHSLGGGITLAFTLAYPAYVDKLILLDNVGFATQVNLFFRLMSVPFLGEKLLKLNRAAFAKVLRTNVYDPHSMTEEFIDWIYPLASHPDVQRTMLNIVRNNASLWGVLPGTLEPLWAGYHQLSHLPMLVIWGRQDRLLSCDAHVEAAKAKLPHITLHVFDQCGHVPQIEHTDAFNRLVLEFLA